ncbi:hypothetical protein ACPA0F_18625 [Solibacillus silvestris]
MIKLLTIGYNGEELPETAGAFLVASHTPGIPIGMTDYEYYLKCKEMASDAVVILVKNKPNNFTEDEVMMLDTAYSNKTPIFYVGTTGVESLLQFMFTNWFSTTEDALDHIQAFY